MTMYAARNLARRPVRTVLTAIGVAVGVASVVMMLATVRSFRNQLSSLFAAGDAHLVLTRRDASDPFLSYLPAALAAEVAGRPGVRSAHPLLLGFTQVRSDPLFLVFGTTEGSPFLTHLRVIEGADPLAEGGHPGRILLGRQAARHLGVGVEGTLGLGTGQYRVAGIFESSTPLLASGAILPLEEAQRLTGLEGKVTSVLLRLRSRDRSAVEEEERSIEASFPVVEASPPGNLTDAFDEFDIMDRGAWLLSALTLVLGGLGVMNTMLMSVFERTREIGILRAIGWSRSMVLREVVAEALLACAAGGLLGAASGAAAMKVIGALPGFSWVAGTYEPGVFVLALAVACGMGLLGATYPAIRAVGVSPVEALRRE